MTVNLSMLAGAGAQFFDNNGVPLAGGLVYTYTAGTTTPQASYTTNSGSTAHANPIVLDSAGRVPSGGEIWLTDAVAYKFVLKTATSTTIGTYDNVTGNASGIYAAFAASSGSSLVGFIQSGTGAVATTVQTKLRETVSVNDFGADPTGASDSRAAFRAAANTGKAVTLSAGTYLINSPIFTDAEVASGLAYQFALIGDAPNGKVKINLINNTTYFSGFGYQPFIQNIWFTDGVDVIHFNTQSIDYSVCRLIDVTCLRWTGVFFKSVTNANSTHITWERPTLVTTSTAAQCFNDNGLAFDNLTVNNGWIETACTASFVTSTDRLTFNSTRFIPYTNSGSFWIQYYGTGRVTVYDTDFGGESARKIIQWNTAGGSFCCVAVTFSSDAGVCDIFLTAPPTTISLTGCYKNTSSSPDLIRVDPSMTAANLLLLSYLYVNKIGCDSTLNTLLVDNNSIAQAYSVVASNDQMYVDNFVKTTDLTLTSGYPNVSGSGGSGFTSTNSVTDVFGTDTVGMNFTATTDGDAYRYFAASNGAQTIGTGDYTFETLCTTTVPCKVSLLFGAPNVTGQARKTYYLGAGTHLLCFPVYITSTMAKTLGMDYACKSGGVISFSRIRVFSGFYNRRDKSFYGTAAPTSANYTWYAGDRVINSAPTVGQPKSWICTATAAPGTWVSEGNL